MRAGGAGGPLQFAYLAADCRIYYTLDSVVNVSSLWRDAARAMWVDSRLCVAGSTGYAASAGGQRHGGASSTRVQRHGPRVSLVVVVVIVVVVILLHGRRQRHGIGSEPRRRPVRQAHTESTARCETLRSFPAALQEDYTCTLTTYRCPGRFQEAIPLRSICLPPCESSTLLPENMECIMPHAVGSEKNACREHMDGTNDQPGPGPPKKCPTKTGKCVPKPESNLASSFPSICKTKW